MRPPSNNGPVEFVRRNYYLGIINGALFHCLSQLVSPATVLAVFAMRLTGSAAMVGLLTSLISLGWMWPQFLLANVLEPLPLKKPFYLVSALGRIISFSCLAPIVLFLARTNPHLCFWLMALVFVVYASVGATGMIRFMDIVGKSIPEYKRGSFFGYRNAFGALLGLLSGAYVKRVLGEDSGLIFPDNYLHLFQVALAILVVSVGAFCLVREPVRRVQKRRIGLGLQLQRGFRILRNAADFRRLMLVRVTMTFAGMGGSFYAVYCIEQLGAPESMVGAIIVVGVCSSALANLLWARVSDHQGNRRVIVLCSAFGCLTPLIAVVTSLFSGRPVHLPWLGTLPLNVACYLATFISAGIATGADMMGIMNYLLEIAPEGRRPSYFGVSYAVITPFMLAPWAAGALARATSYQTVFVIAAVCAVVALSQAVRLREPRGSLVGRDM